MLLKLFSQLILIFILEGIWLSAPAAEPLLPEVTTEPAPMVQTYQLLGILKEGSTYAAFLETPAQAILLLRPGEQFNKDEIKVMSITAKSISLAFLKTTLPKILTFYLKTS